MSAKHKIKLRKNDFVEKISTNIWQEIPSKDNPYQAEQHRCYGYDLIDLMNNRSFVDVLFLIMRGELPSTSQHQILERLMIAYINPGPRNPATLAAMNCGLSRTNRAHILPISSTIQGGEYLGGAEVEKAMRFILENINNEAKEVAQGLLNDGIKAKEGDWHITPGFGTHYGSIERHQQKIVNGLLKLSLQTKHLAWCQQLVEQFSSHGLGWLSTGVVAATLCDLGFHPREGAGMFQIISAPGLLAHGIEMSNKPLTAMPFLDNEQYIIES